MISKEEESFSNSVILDSKKILINIKLIGVRLWTKKDFIYIYIYIYIYIL